MATDQELLVAFRDIDKSSTGVITASELRTYLYQKRFNELFVQKYLRLFDRNHDGRITLEEYEKTLSEIPKNQRQYSQWRQMFEGIDKDGNGYITKSELQTAVAEMGAKSLFKLPDFERFFKKGDADHDGRMNYREFLEWMSKSEEA